MKNNIALDNCRIMSILAVVVLHASATTLEQSKFGSADWWVANIIDSATRWCVPVFVMLSGALLLNPNKIEPLNVFLKKRFSKILVPMVFWSIFYLSWNSKAIMVGTISLKTLVNGKPHYHMWFIYMIATLYIFVPFIRKITTQSSRDEVNFLLATSFFIAAINAIFIAAVGQGPSLFANWFLWFIPYFIVGPYIVAYKLNADFKTTIAGLALCITLTATGYFFFLASGKNSEAVYFYNYLSITTIPMSLLAFATFMKWDTPIISEKMSKKLSRLTLGVYFIHPIVLETIYPFKSTLHLAAAVDILATTIITVVFSTIMTWTISVIPYAKRII